MALRLQKALKSSLADNHLAMDKGLELEAYHQLVGRNKALRETLELIKQLVLEMGEEME